MRTQTTRKTNWIQNGNFFFYENISRPPCLTYSAVGTLTTVLSQNTTVLSQNTTVLESARVLGTYVYFVGGYSRNFIFELVIFRTKSSEGSRKLSRGLSNHTK